MKKQAKRWRLRVGSVVALSLMLCGFLTLYGRAEGENPYAEQWQASGAQEWVESLPESTKELLDMLGITPSDLSSITALQPEKAAEGLLTVAQEKKQVPLSITGTLLATILLCSLLDGLRKLPGSAVLSDTYKTVGVLAVCGVVLLPLCTCIQAACEAATSAFVLMGSFAPLYAAVLTAAGDPTAALSFQTVVLFCAQCMSGFLSGAAAPLLTVSLGIGTAGSLDDTFPLCGVSRFINRLCTWALGLFCTVFVGLLSLQTLVGTRADGVAIRAVRFSLANLVPVVGNAVSEAFGTVQNCLLVLKTTLGGLGVIVTGTMLLPPLIECGWWALLLSLCSAVSEALSFSALTGLLRLCADVVKTLVGLLVCCGLFLIIAITVVTLAAQPR